jgi:ribosomal-protein-alanine N-acetyltransferase
MYLRELEYSDKDVLTKIYGDEEVMRYIGRGGIVPEDKIPIVIDHWKRSYSENNFGLWGVIEKGTDTLIGHCGFAWLPEISEIEIAYLLYKDYWGKGMASEAAISTLNYGHNVLGLTNIVALVYPQNLASIKVIEKLGMEYVNDEEIWGVKLQIYQSEKK